ncbi:hypothetical protein [Nocardiopsis aegyptia]|uniref:Uncharacterized protein n=1 Tax=Nocardiopsis aegyptia TaxID=220378 RepID=A0A7Z0J8C7_9ACTN|nr:hypothetical protein [Nocardiopsis aegyptia]NYJ32836.1 hypothetical protein [Nocardiopsis aegyptia]
MSKERDAKCFADGAWTTVPDEFWAAWPEGDGYDEAFKATGYETWIRVGDADATALPMTLTIHSRQAEPRYLVFIEGAHSHLEWVYARELPDAMELLCRWTPTVQSATVAEVIRQFNDPYGENRDTVELLKKLLGCG